MSKSSLILDEGAGNPTWSRATKAWGFNELGYLEELASGCAFFGGARLVRNRVVTKSEDFSNAAWGKTNITPASVVDVPAKYTTAFSLIPTAVPGQHYISNTAGTPVSTTGTAYIVSVIAKAFGYSHLFFFTSNAAVYFDLSAGTVGSATGSSVGSTSIISLGNGWYECRIRCINLTGTNFEIHSTPSNGVFNYLGDGVSGAKVSAVSFVDVTGYDASYIPEYVSVGSDTDKNFLLHTDDFSQAAWTKTNITHTQSAIANPVNGLINAQKVEATADAATNMYQSVTNCGSTAGNIASFYVKQGSGATDANRFLVRNVTTATNLLSINVNYSTGVITYVVGSSGASVTDVGNGWWLVKLVVTSGISNNDTLSGYIAFAGGPETAGEFCYIYRPYLGRGTTAPAVLPAVADVWDPFGAGTDGAKYFETDWQGAPIAAANLLGFRREAAATNNLLHSRDLSNAAWSTKTNITAGKTATGLDGIANTATTLTAAAADAIILQPITLASAVRCASTYVKRRTGTGTISFTQDGGSTWTDITSQINSSTWSRVQITATLANPSVGFKISTSGDAIDVDCVQNEAGAEATSPIVTTTATITRNADSLTYQTASNIDFAVGTLYCEAQFASSLTTRRAVLVGPDGYSYINSGDANTLWKAYDGTNIVSKSGLSDISTAKRKRVVSWGTGLKVTGDGISPASGSFDGAFGSGSSMEIGQNINGYIGPVAIYNYQMTDAELQALTT
jgi:hypothetical protein